jgi:hypothetical protein
MMGHFHFANFLSPFFIIIFMLSNPHKGPTQRKGKQNCNNHIHTFWNLERESEDECRSNFSLGAVSDDRKISLGFF